MVSYPGLAVHVLVSVATVFLATSFHLSTWILIGLHSYFLPEASVLGEQKEPQSGNGSENTTKRETEPFVTQFDPGKEQVDSTAGTGEKEGKSGNKFQEHDSEQTDLSRTVVENANTSGVSGDISHVEREDESHIPKKKGGEKQGSNLKGKAGAKEFRELSKSSRKRKEKSKDKLDWNDGSSQIIRVHLSNSQLQGRMYFKEYNEAVIYLALGLANLLTHEFLILLSASESVNRSWWHSFLKNDDLIPLLICAFAVFKIAQLLALAAREIHISQRFDLILSWCVGFLGFLVAIVILYLFPITLINFGFKGTIFESEVSFFANPGSIMDSKAGGLSVIRSLAKLMLAVMAGWLSGIFLAPAHNCVRSFWLGTDQLQWNISVISWGPLTHFLLYLNIVMPLFTSILWIKPMAELFICEPSLQTFSTGGLTELSLYGGSDNVPTGHHQFGVDYSQGVDLDYIETVDGQNLEKEYWNKGGKVAGWPMCNEERCIREVKRKADNFQVNGIGTVKQIGDQNEDTELASETRGKDEGFTFWRKGVLQAPSKGWFEKVGMPESTFEHFQLWSLLLAGLLQLCLLRVNLQTYLNNGVLIWYESLHRSRTVNLDVTRASLILNNYFLCRVSLQFLAPGMLILLFLGSARASVSQAGSPTMVGISFFCCSFKVAALFMAWWVAFAWAILTCTILALYRLGFLLAFQ